VQPCVGRGSGVRPPLFSESDLRALEATERPSRLVVIGDVPTPTEQAYLEMGQSLGLPRRYLLGRRDPWYRAEIRAPAPIWAGVFGRSGLRFVLNQSAALTLNTFHGIYPYDKRPIVATALAAVLNSRIVTNAARPLSRVYGGGLLKFEPRDLLEIPVPDLRALDETWLNRLAELLGEVDRAARAGGNGEAALAVLDSAVLAAGAAAVRSAENVATFPPERGR
jgi:adenine-specific DNA-methyltransferase